MAIKNPSLESKKIFKESSKSLELLKRILYLSNSSETIVADSSSLFIRLNNEILTDTNGKIFLIYNENSRILRRQDKKAYEYLNFYKSNSSLLSDIFLYSFDYDGIIKIISNDKICFKLMENSNKEIFMRFYDFDEKLGEHPYLCRFIEEYLNHYEDLDINIHDKPISIEVMMSNTEKGEKHEYYIKTSYSKQSIDYSYT